MSHRGKTSPYSVSRRPVRGPTPSQEQRFSLQGASQLTPLKRPTRSNVSQSWVEKAFRQILNEIDVSVNSLQVIVTDARLQAQVSFDQTKHVKLEYRSEYFRTLTEDEIVSVLSHEACHVAVLPHTMYFPGPPDFVDWQTTFVDIYDEFLAHEEFYSRYKDSPRLPTYARIKIGEFANYHKILQTVREGLVNPQFGLFNILNDATFFPIVRSPAVFEWCATNKASMTEQVLQWILEDCQYVKSLGRSREDTVLAVIEIARFWAGVDARSEKWRSRRLARVRQ